MRNCALLMCVPILLDRIDLSLPFINFLQKYYPSTTSQEELILCYERHEWLIK